MTYEITSEQIEKDKSTNMKVMIFMLVLFLGIGMFFFLPAYLKGTLSLGPVLIISSIVLVLAMVGGVVGAKDRERKRVRRVETTRASVILLSERGPDEIKGDSIRRLTIHEDISGEVQLIFLMTQQSPSVFLRGFQDMDRLASDLEKMVEDPSKVSRARGKGGKGKAMGGVLLVAILLAVLAVFGGMIWGLHRIGFGFLVGPLSITLLGISKFAGSRRDRSNRMAGIGMIFGGVLWAVFEFISIVSTGGK